MKIVFQKLFDNVSSSEAFQEIQETRERFRMENRRIVRTRPRTPEETDALVKFYVDGTRQFKSGGTTKDGRRRLIFQPDN